MDTAEITPESLSEILLDRDRREVLIAAMRREHGSHLPLSNRVADIAAKCVIDSSRLDRVVDILLERDSDDDHLVLDWLVFHPAMREESLIRLLDCGRCIGSLAHRSGPEYLLLRLAREHRYPEAILTLALYHYGPDAARREDFLAFVNEYVYMEWLRESLRVSDAAGRIPEAGRQAALRLVEEYEMPCRGEDRLRQKHVDVRWLTSTVVDLAGIIQKRRAYHRMPELSDALERAGCTDADILAHCRGPNRHVRGCWVIDLLLGIDAL
jgi:hypothetical protein